MYMDNYAPFYDATMGDFSCPKAKKLHFCTQCDDDINPGQYYFQGKFFREPNVPYQGDPPQFATVRICSRCAPNPGRPKLEEWARYLLTAGSELNECCDKIRIQFGEHSLQLRFSESYQENGYSREMVKESIGPEAMEIMCRWPVGDVAKYYVLNELRWLRGFGRYHWRKRKKCITST